MQNQSFTGSFRIKPNEVKAKIEIPELFTQGRQIFNDILETGDRVIVLRNNYDKRVAAYIQDKNVKGIEYYPDINTKSGLDDEKPEGLLKLINDKANKVITDIEEICKVCAKQKRSPKAISAPAAQNVIDNVSNALRLNIENPQVTSTAKSTVIRDELKKRTIEVIMQDKGTSYVHVIPDSLSERSIRCIIDNKGNVAKYFDTPDEIHKFLKKFRELKSEQVNIPVKNNV